MLSSSPLDGRGGDCNSSMRGVQLFKSSSAGQHTSIAPSVKNGEVVVDLEGSAEDSIERPDAQRNPDPYFVLSRDVKPGCGKEPKPRENVLDNKELV